MSNKDFAIRSLIIGNFINLISFIVFLFMGRINLALLTFGCGLLATFMISIIIENMKN